MGGEIERSAAPQSEVSALNTSTCTMPLRPLLPLPVLVSGERVG